MAKIKELTLKALSETDNGKTLFDGDGLRGEVRANASGISVSFSYRYRFAGRAREIRCGTWPKDKLSAVRDVRDQARVLIAKGTDPAQARQDVKSELRKQADAARAATGSLAARPTVRALFDEWHRRDLVTRKDSGAETRRAFEKDVFPKIGHLQIAEVSRRQVMTILDDVLERGCNRMAKRLLADLRQMYGFAIDREVVEADPTMRIAKKRIGGEEVERDRVLSESEIRELACKLPGSGLSSAAQAAFWIMLATCCRVGELSMARWQDVDLSLGTWLIPAENAKNGRKHLVHLSAFSVAQFETLREIAMSIDWIYPSRDGSSHVSTKALQKQFKDRQRELAFRGRSKRPGTLMLAGGEWRAHDLRRTGATLMGELGVRSDVIERAMNHVETKGVARVYQRQELMNERAHAFALLGERLALLSDVGKSNVVVGRFSKVA
ncbi:site-specific integrase [uncultured Nevskia sp.]|uniref:tyrosine-type recombinase/integrase n=1 Tax=uncultured Nevskia sp. TaxID=228950 RepID=UPI0025EECE78|nr:site-specific integrase [uncultured Nevskia sp.]